MYCIKESVDRNPAVLTRLYYIRFQCLRALGHIDDALKAIDELILRSPGEDDFYIEKAYTLFVENQYEKSLEAIGTHDIYLPTVM